MEIKEVTKQDIQIALVYANYNDTCKVINNINITTTTKQNKKIICKDVNYNDAYNMTNDNRNRNLRNHKTK